jgi:hypothetical protein
MVCRLEVNAVNKGVGKVRSKGGSHRVDLVAISERECKKIVITNLGVPVILLGCHILCLNLC